MSKNDQQILVIPRSEFDKRGAFRGYQPLADAEGAILREDVGEYLGLGDSGTRLPCAHFMRRGDAEQDPGFKQIIPYAVILLGKSVFVYERPTSGGEERLHNKLSVGLGGHVENSDDTDPFWAYMKALQRELKEEVGLQLDFNALSGTLHGLVNDDQDGEGKGEVAVGQVHLGLVHIVCVNENMATEIVKNAAANEVLNPRFIPIKEFAEGDLKERLESWSGFIVDKLVADLQIEGPWTRADVRERIAFLSLTASKIAATATGLLLQEDTRGWLLSKDKLEEAMGEYQCLFSGCVATGDLSQEAIVGYGHIFRAKLPTCTRHQDFEAKDSSGS